MNSRLLVLPCLVLLACPSGPKQGTAAYNAACATDAECASGRCLPGADDTGYCTQECGLDLDCANEDTLLCCERLGDLSYCTKPGSGECRQAQLGSGCQGPDDPFCARSQLFCADAGGRQVCTFECQASADCAEVRGSVCGPIAEGQLVCIPPDINNLTRLTSNCAGDRDCTGDGEICQMVLDNDVDPRTYVLRCSSSQKYGPKAAYAQCTANRECDRFFCVSNECPATCTNDSHCRPAHVCEPVGLPVPTATGESSDASTIIGLCVPQQGSYRSCDSAAASCPTGESCQIAIRFDGGADTVCRALPTEASTMPPVSATYAKTDEACSRLVDSDNDPATAATWQLVGNEIKLCESGTCLAPGYCSSACRVNTDCAPGPSGPVPASDLVCIYEPFFPHCERTVATGKAIGEACSAASVRLADGQCGTTYCNAGACTARKSSGQTCDRANECRSFICLTGKCTDLCRTDVECGVNRACDTLPQVFDIFQTPTVDFDDAIDLPSVCVDLLGNDGTACPQAACGAGLSCMPIGARDGSLRGLCATPAAGSAMGETCTSDTGCQTKLCLGFGNEPTGRCSGVCIDNTDCPGATRCIPTTVSGTAVTKLCLLPNGTVDEDGACTTPGNCKSNLCVDGKCAALCPRTVALGAECAAGKPCAQAAISLNPRLTAEVWDDQFDYVSTCVQGAVGYSGDLGACAAPKQFVFRPTDAGTLAGACLTPLTASRAEGKDCQAATECQSGLCVDHKCAKACTAAPADSCGATAASRCDVAARAQVDENNSVTAVAPACRAACTMDSECPSTSVCEPDPMNGSPRFCRLKCVADKDCSPGQTCVAGPPQHCQ